MVHGSWHKTGWRLGWGPAAPLGPGDIIIISDTASVVTAFNGWTYDVPSDITGVCVREL